MRCCPKKKFHCSSRISSKNSQISHQETSSTIIHLLSIEINTHIIFCAHILHLLLSSFDFLLSITSLLLHSSAHLLLSSFDLLLSLTSFLLHSSAALWWSSGEAHRSQNECLLNRLIHQVLWWSTSFIKWMLAQRIDSSNISDGFQLLWLIALWWSSGEAHRSQNECLLNGLIHQTLVMGSSCYELFDGDATLDDYATSSHLM